MPVNSAATSTGAARRSPRREKASSRADLERLVEARTKDLQESQARLAQAQRMQALGQLAGGIAHDFNNVLQAIETSAGLIERHAADPGGVRRLISTIGAAAERGAAVTRRLLAFSRRGDLRAAPVDVAALFTGMRDILAHTLGSGIEIRLDVPAGLPPLLADKGQLETVLVNLATNARDAMPAVGVLTLAAAPEILQHGEAPGHRLGRKPGSYVCLSVSDTGTGMDATTLARASEPFFTTKPAGKGTGLGLAMARGFAEQSGGGLSVESARGRGTTVRLWFPVAAQVPRAPPRAGEEAGPVPSGTHARLLLVDDDALVRDLLAERMPEAGYPVLPAASGADALALLDSGEAVDLLVSDLSMPGMDGITLIEQAHRRRPGLPAILLTGFATDDAEIPADRAFSLLRKPVGARQLAERVAALLQEADTPH